MERRSTLERRVTSHEYSSLFITFHRLALLERCGLLQAFLIKLTCQLIHPEKQYAQKVSYMKASFS